MITLSHLHKSFGDFLAVNDLSLEIKEGEILGFLGPNGAGKTTTIRLICGLLEADKGQILWNGSPKRSTASIGVCSQENIYWPRLTGKEQLVFQAKIYGLSTSLGEQRATDLLKKLGLTAKANVLAEKLSGGMKRRLNIALALVHDPSVLILDEPEAGLDPQSRILVRELIRELGQSKTIILTTHNMDEAERLADRVAIIDHGQLLKVGRVSDLKLLLGEEDVMELLLDIESGAEMQLADFALRLDLVEESLSLRDNRLSIKRAGVMDILPKTIKGLKERGVGVLEVSMRPKTLEDVFIHLTGRGLRE